MKKLAIFITLWMFPFYAFALDGNELKEEKGYFTLAKEFFSPVYSAGEEFFDEHRLEANLSLKNSYFFERTWQFNSSALHYFFDGHWSASCGYRKFGKWFQSTEKEKILAAHPYTIKPKCPHSLDLSIYMTKSHFSFVFFGGTDIEGYLPSKKKEPLENLVYSGVKAFVEF